VRQRLGAGTAALSSRAAAHHPRLRPLSTPTCSTTGRPHTPGGAFECGVPLRGERRVPFGLIASASRPVQNNDPATVHRAWRPCAATAAPGNSLALDGLVLYGEASVIFSTPEDANRFPLQDLARPRGPKKVAGEGLISAYCGRDSTCGSSHPFRYSILSRRADTPTGHVRLRRQSVEGAADDDTARTGRRPPAQVLRCHGVYLRRPPGCSTDSAQPGYPSSQRVQPRRPMYCAWERLDTLDSCDMSKSSQPARVHYAVGFRARDCVGDNPFTSSPNTRRDTGAVAHPAP
jgi:hypothetical protein